MDDEAIDRQEKYKLHEAVRSGDFSGAVALVKEDASAAGQFDPDGRLPIHWAVALSQRDITSYLFDLMPHQKWDVNTTERGGTEWTMLMLAVSVGDEAIFDLVMQKTPDVNQSNDRGQQAMHFAASKNRLGFARQLVRRGASARRKDKQGVTPLHRAAAIGAIPFLQFLLESKVSVNASDDQGLTALHHAVVEGHGEAAMVLLRAGGDPYAEDRNGVKAVMASPDEKIGRHLTRQCEAEGLEFK